MKWKTEVGGCEPGQIYPVGDEREHVTGGLECWCEPTVLYIDEKTGIPFAYPIVVHNAADFRELIEQAEEINHKTP